MTGAAWSYTERRLSEGPCAARPRSSCCCQAQACRNLALPHTTERPYGSPKASRGTGERGRRTVERKANQLLRDLVRVRAKPTPPAVRSTASSAWARSWWAMLRCSRPSRALPSGQLGRRRRSTRANRRPQNWMAACSTLLAQQGRAACRYAAPIGKSCCRRLRRSMRQGRETHAQQKGPRKTTLSLRSSLFCYCN